MSQYMNENIFGSNDMIFNQSGGGIQSGGLSIKSMMISKGLSPIMSINIDKDPANVERVSDLFHSDISLLGIPSYNIFDKKYIYDDDESCGEDKDNEIDLLYDKLLKLVEPAEKEIDDNDLIFLGGKKKNKSRKNKEPKLSKINGHSKSKKNMNLKISNK